MWKDSGVTWKSAQFLIFTIVVVFFLHLYSGREHSCKKARLVLGAHPPGLILMWHQLVHQNLLYLPSKSKETTKQQIMSFSSSWKPYGIKYSYVVVQWRQRVKL